MANYEVTFNRNVKFGDETFREGEKTQVAEADLDALTDVIESDYTEVEGVEDDKGKTDSIDSLTVDQLKAYAAENGIDVDKAKKRDELIEAIHAAEGTE